MRKQIQIKTLDFVKEGTSGKGAWQLYNLVDTNNDKYTLFGSNKIAGMEPNKTFDIDFRVEERSGFTNRTITKVYLPNTNPTSAPDSGLESQLGLLTGQVQQLELRVKRLEGNNTPMPF